ncbi:hypothetical protein [Paenibacillus silvae]|uniref:Uncharacterized protein n=1 Tax=Paenibacillus silvae TaxID=1325358 RepID=A0A2W6NNB7_9BACL|nr:hypothetical protein [Paenibacillus silvae]PZT57342.1 hypothetical protein DN757_01410 [Paenibacillus silvae]
MKITVNKVGKRWYIVSIEDDQHWLSRKELANVEVTRHDGGNWSKFETTWTMTGKGSRKYRNEILKELNDKHKGDNELHKEYLEYMRKWRNRDK